MSTNYLSDRKLFEEFFNKSLRKVIRSVDNLFYLNKNKYCAHSIKLMLLIKI
jgi:hypothetical protein